MVAFIFVPPGIVVGGGDVGFGELETRFCLSDGDNGRGHADGDEVAQLFSDKNVVLDIKLIQGL